MERETGALVLGVVDLSGSMAGQSIAAARNQVQELLAELQSAQRFSTGQIRMGLLGFHREAWWLMEPRPVGEIVDLPALRIAPDEGGLYPRGGYVSMLDALSRILDGELRADGARPVHVILFSDLLSTEPEHTLRARLERMNRAKGFKRCRRYVIREETDPRRQACCPWLDRAFAGETGYVTDPAGFSAMAAQLHGELAGGGHDGPETVF